MELYLVRHAIAAERGDEWPDDSKRPLTERGISRFKEVVRGLRAAGTNGKATVKTLEALAPEHTPAAVLTQLAKAAKRTRVALVGHEPGLGELAAHLIGAQRALAFRKGGIARIDVGSITSRRAGSLIWFLPPKVLRQLAG